MDNLLVLEFRGEIDIFAQRWIERVLHRIEDFGGDAFTILDLTRLRYLDTTCLSALMRIRKRLMQQRSDVRMCLVASSRGIVRRLLEMTQLATLFTFFDDVPSARRSGFTALPQAVAVST